MSPNANGCKTRWRCGSGTAQCHFQGATAGLACWSKDLRYVQINETLAEYERGFPSPSKCLDTIGSGRGACRTLRWSSPDSRTVLRHGPTRLECGSERQGRPNDSSTPLDTGWQSFFAGLRTGWRPDGVGAIVGEITEAQAGRRGAAGKRKADSAASSKPLRTELLCLTWTAASSWPTNRRHNSSALIAPMNCFLECQMALSCWCPKTASAPETMPAS